ncbi:hypothetical protein MPS38_003040 [Salmonella enterica]|nr:hypothetical protein [Salmonella enterica]
MEFVKEIDGKKVITVKASDGKFYLVWEGSIIDQTNKKGQTYNKSPCKNCGDVRRYVSNDHCPTCHNKRNKIARAKNQ